MCPSESHLPLRSLAGTDYHDHSGSRGPIRREPCSADAGDSRPSALGPLRDFRVGPQAESDLDEIWYFLATQSDSVDVTEGVIDSATARFGLLATHPYIGRRRDQDLRPGVRTFTVGDYVIA